MSNDDVRERIDAFADAVETLAAGVYLAPDALPDYEALGVNGSPA